MYVINFTDDYDNHTVNDKSFDIFIPTFLLTKPCRLSFLCLLSLMMYTLIKHLFNTKGWRSFYTQLIQFAVS